MFCTVTLLVGERCSRKCLSSEGRPMKIKSPNSNRNWRWWTFRLPLLTLTVTVSSTWVFKMYDMRMVHSTIEGYTTKQSEWQLASDIQMARTFYQTKKPPLLFVCCTLSQLSSPYSTSSCTCPPYTPLLSAALIIPLAITSFTVYSFYPEVFLGGPWINFCCTHPTRECCEYSLFMAPIPLATGWVQVYGIHQPVYSKPLLHSCTLKPIPCKCSARQRSGWCHYWIAIAKTCYTYAWAPQDSGTGDPWPVCLSHSVLACAWVLGMQGMVIKHICIEE